MITSLYDNDVVQLYADHYHKLQPKENSQKQSLSIFPNFTLGHQNVEYPERGRQMALQKAEPADK